MSYSGHKSLKSFSLYEHAEQGCIATDQRIESVGLASFAGTKGISGTVNRKRKPLEKQRIAVS